LERTRPAGLFGFAVITTTRCCTTLRYWADAAATSRQVVYEAERVILA
jgi:hypothetical protein